MKVKPGYKQTEVGVIPEDWKAIDLSGLCTLQRGFDITESTRLPGTVPVYSSSGLSYFHSTAMVNPPGVVTGRKGILGKVFLINEPFWPHDTTLWVKDFKGNLPAYVALVLQNFHLEHLDAATSVPTLNRNNLAGHLVPLPSTKAEQQAIAGALSDADALIESLQQLIAKKHQIKQGSMQELLTGKKRLPGFSGAWEIKRLGELGSTFGGLTGKSKDDFGHGSVHYITFMNIMTNVVINCGTFELVDVKPTETQNRVAKGDLFFNGSSETPEEVGMCAVLANEVQDVFLNSFCFGFRFREGAPADGLYLAYYFRSREGRELLKSLAQGATRYNLSKTAFMKVSFPLPQVKEQTAITAILSDMDADIAALEENLTKARHIKQGMMQELLTGKVRLV
jgi:type I restriction enzyme S subunit